MFDDALDKAFPHTRNPWKKPTKEIDLTNYPDAASPPSIDYLRDLWATPHSTHTVEQLRVAGRQAKEIGDQRLRDRFDKWNAGSHWRTWTDAEGQTIEAIVVRHFANEITVRTRKGLEITFDVAKLAATDQQRLNATAELIIPNDSDAWREFVFVGSLGIVRRFHETHHQLPPRALADRAGQPRLSWRVLLLREL